jgi:hypothetical protein
MNLRLLLLLLALAAVTHAAPAQTARIAHLSHSGSLETLDAADNFGIVGPYFIRDSVRLLTDTTALEYGRWEGPRAPEKATKSQIIQFSPRRADGNYASPRANYLRGLRSSYHPVKLVGDTLPGAAKAAPPQPAKPRRKKSAVMPSAPAPPQHPGVALAVAAILVFAGAGWLLGERRPGPRPQAA